jgi:hypothetical protein
MKSKIYYRFKCMFYVCLTLSIFNSYSQTAKEVVKGMGPGFNLGNVFDNGNKSTTFTSFKPIIDSYAAAGMTNIRIPTTWYDYVSGTRLTDVNGNIDKTNPRFIELVKTVDYALSKGLYVVLNTHHEHWLKDNYNGSAYYNTIFANLWTSIANHFKSYSSKLAFEVLNEPEGVMGQWGEPVLPTAQSGILLTRQINKVGYDAIRATGGNNITRIVMISPNGQANDSQIEEVYPNVSTLPGGGNDKYLAMHVHSYDPWNFCGQTGTNASYPGVTQIKNDITVCNTHAQNNLGGIALDYGEFGVGRSTNQAERSATVVTEYYQTFAKTCIDLGIAFSVWDDRGWFSLINDAGSAFTYNLVPNMLSVINRAPTVSTTAPATGSSYTSGTSITLAATAADTAPGTVTSVSFYDGTTLIGTDTSSPYTYSWTPTVGSHSVTAKATDNGGATATSSAITITVTTSSSDPFTSSYFHLIDKFTSDYMRPTGGTATAFITQYEETAVPTFSSYQWEFIASPVAGYYYIVNRYTGKAIQPTGGSTVDNTNLSQTTLVASTTNTELQWAIETSDEANYYWIKNRKSGMYIRPAGGANGTGIEIVQNTINTAYSSFKWSLANPVAKTTTAKSSTAKTASPEEIVSTGIIVYPNPASDNITIATSVDKTATVSILLYDFSGNLILSKEFRDIQGNFEKSIDINTIPTGNYVLKIKKGDTVETQKIIKK